MDDCPMPTFISIDDDGALHLTWCFDAQGAADSSRIMFMWEPKEGPMTARIDKGGAQTVDETATAGLTLARLLTEQLSPGRDGKE
jgi:hypothetical protein